MVTKMIFKEIRVLKAVPFVLLLLSQGGSLLAQTANASTQKDEFPYMEVFGSIAAIIVLILIAWMIGSKQSRPASSDEYHPHLPRRHFDHPNDPHFKKIKRKTS